MRIRQGTLWLCALTSVTIVGCARQSRDLEKAAPTGPVFTEAQVDVAARLLKMSVPRCPPELYQLGIDGHAVVAYVVGINGRAEAGSIRIVRSNHASVERPAIEAVRRARFQPAEKDGHPVRMQIEQRFNFLLARRAG